MNEQATEHRNDEQIRRAQSVQTRLPASREAIPSRRRRNRVGTSSATRRGPTHCASCASNGVGMRCHPSSRDEFVSSVCARCRSVHRGHTSPCRQGEPGCLLGPPAAPGVRIS
jgi:hypothetical protein